MKKILFSLFIIFYLLTSANFVLAAGEGWELEVGVPGLKKDTPIKDPGQYFEAVYKFAVALGAILAVVMIIYGGFIWMTSPAIANIQKGKEMITGAISGLILLLASYLILYTINPELTGLSSPGLQDVSIDTNNTNNNQNNNPNNNNNNNQNNNGNNECGPVQSTNLAYRTNPENHGYLGRNGAHKGADSFAKQGTPVIARDTMKVVDYVDWFTPVYGSAPYSGALVVYYPDRKVYGLYGEIKRDAIQYNNWKKSGHIINKGETIGVIWDNGMNVERMLHYEEFSTYIDYNNKTRINPEPYLDQKYSNKCP